MKYHNKQETNMIYYFFNQLPCEEYNQYWLSVCHDRGTRFNAVNYHRMLQFEKIFKQYGASTNHLLSLKGPVCCNHCWKNAMFGNPNAFGSNIRGEMVKQYLLHLKIKKNQIPSIPIVIIELIGCFISIVPYK